MISRPRRPESAPASRAGGFVEPSESVVLRYGSHRVRLVVAVGLLFAGGIAVQFGSVYTLPLLLGGLAASVAGWCILPSPGWRRGLALVLGVLGVAALLNGAASGVLLSLTLAGWLLARMRPLRSFITLPLPAVAALMLAIPFPQYGGGVVVGGTLGLVLVGSAWLSRSLAAWTPPRLAVIFQGRHRDHRVN